MKIHTDDQVIVIAGKDKGKTAKVTRAFPAEKKVSTPGQKVTFEKPIDVSNVMLIDPKTSKPTRVGYKIENGKKMRVAKKSGTVL